MKKYIGELAGISLLKRNARLESGKYYLLHSESTGNTRYFEGEDEVNYAKEVFKRNFGGMVDIVFEMYTSRGILLFVRTGERESLKEEWIKRGKALSSESFIISELLRFSISAITKFRNFRNGRKGSVVRGNFRAYDVKDVDRIEEIIGEIERGDFVLYEQVEKYCGGEKSEVGIVSCWVKEISFYVLRKLMKLAISPQNQPIFNSNPDLSPP